MSGFSTTMIQLTAKEQEIFELFRGAMVWKQRATVARVAGGWVRDKLLGRESDDIDIALDDQTGVEFASSVQEYMTSLGQTARRVAVIEANPEKSKHLETATSRVLDVSVDFVNLRAETYGDDSRIPEIRFGTPLEDALRRDFTINALFYNINSSAVEDITGLGLGDLRSSILRTPMDPFVTFKDDPLRVIRAVRFAARFDLAVDPPLLAAARSAEMHRGLEQKVSRERVLKELEGALGGSSCRPALALELLASMDLFSKIFAPVGDPATWVPTAAPPCRQPFLSMLDAPSLQPTSEALPLNSANYSICTVMWYNALLGLSRKNAISLLCVPSGASAGGDPAVVDVGDLVAPLYCAKAARDTETLEPAASPIGPDASPTSLRLAFWAAAVSGLEAASAPDSRKKEIQMLRQSSLLLRDSLKTDNETQKEVRAVLDGSEQFFLLANPEHLVDSESTTTAMAQAPERVRLGLAVRVAKEFWPVALWLACARELTASSEQAAGRPHDSLVRVATEEASARASAEGQAQAQEGGYEASRPRQRQPIQLRLNSQRVGIMQRYFRLHQRVSVLGLGNAWALRPLLDGQALKKALSLGTGPAVGAAVEAQLLWQLEHPAGSAEEMIAFLHQR